MRVCGVGKFVQVPSSAVVKSEEIVCRPIAVGYKIMIVQYSLYPDIDSSILQ